MQPISAKLGNVVFRLVVLLFLPAILGTLEVDGLLVPVQGMVNEILGMLPNIFGAIVIGVVGWFLAKIVRDLVSNLLTAAGTDRLGEQIGLRGTMSLSHLIALVMYILILVPAVVAALQALEIEVITGPATHMLNTMMSAIPDIFAAAIILGIAFAISRLVSQLVANLSGGLGFDTLPEKLGLGQAFTGSTAPSSVVGNLLAFFYHFICGGRSGQPVRFSSGVGTGHHVYRVRRTGVIGKRHHCHRFLVVESGLSHDYPDSWHSIGRRRQYCPIRSSWIGHCHGTAGHGVGQ